MNTDLLSKVLIFAAGAAVGSLVTWRLMRYEVVECEEECDEAVEEEETKEDDSEESSENKEMVRYHKILKESRYSSDETDRKEENDVERPYVISPDDFNELDGYQVVTLYLCADGVLVDDNDNVIEDVDDVVGEDSLETFGQYEDDTVFVRNDRLKMDIEVLRDMRRYFDEHPAEEE